MPAIRVVALLAAAVAGSAAAQTPAWQDLSLPFERRAADLVGRMTLEEKIFQMMDRAPAIDRLGIPEYNWWNEAVIPRRGEADGLRKHGHEPRAGDAVETLVPPVVLGDTQAIDGTRVSTASPAR